MRVFWKLWTFMLITTQISLNWEDQKQTGFSEIESGVVPVTAGLKRADKNDPLSLYQCRRR